MRATTAAPPPPPRHTDRSRGTDDGHDHRYDDDDADADDEWVLNVTLARWLGLLQILDADGGPRACGRNAYHVAVAAAGAFMLATVALAPAGFYRLAGDAVASTFYAGCVGNYAFACYKAAVVVGHSRRIRRLVDAAARGFMRRGRYAGATFARWRGRTVRGTGAYAALAAVVVLVWAAAPRAFPRVSVAVRGAHGSPDAEYRLNVFNVYPMVPARAHNGHYEAFYAAECAVLVCFMYTSAVFDVLVVTVCLAFACQLDAVCGAVRSLGYDDKSEAQLSSQLCEDDDKKSTQNVIKQKGKINVFNDLKDIIEDYQTVMQKLEDFYNIFRPVILSQIFVASSSHVLIWFIGAMNLSKTENSLITTKLFIVLPVFTTQLFMACNLFGTINEKKDELNLSLYSSNWIDMDLKSKELILSVMKLNNANQLKMKVTRTKIVNLEMFSQTMRLCYSIFSMLVKYKKT